MTTYSANKEAKMIAGLVNIAANYLNTGLVGKRYGTAHESIVPYQAFKTKDGYMIVGAANDKLFVEMCEILHRADLSRDPRFQTNADRVIHRNILIPLLDEMYEGAYWTDACSD